MTSTTTTRTSSMGLLYLLTFCILLSRISVPGVNAAEVVIPWAFAGQDAAGNQLDRLPDFRVLPGDTIVFQLENTHNVYLNGDDTCFQTADAELIVDVGSFSPLAFYDIPADTAVGTEFYFLCTVFQHCDPNGMRVRVIVVDESEAPSAAPSVPPTPAPTPSPTEARASDIKILWDFPPGNDPLPSFTASPGDRVIFDWTGTHNLNLYEDATCVRTPGAVTLANTTENSYTFTIPADASGGTVYYFVCDVGNGAHCDAGMKFTVTVEGDSNPTAAPTSDSWSLLLPPRYSLHLGAAAALFFGLFL